MCSQQSKGAKYPQKSFNCADAFSIKITRFHAALKPIFRSLKPFQAFSSLLNLGARDFSFYMNTHTHRVKKRLVVWIKAAGPSEALLIEFLVFPVFEFNRHFVPPFALGVEQDPPAGKDG